MKTKLLILALAFAARSLPAATLVASDGEVGDNFGVSNSVSVSGGMALVGDFTDDIGLNANQGSAYVYRGLATASGTNTQDVKLVTSDGAANDLFGASLSVSGSMGLVGAYGDTVGANTQQGSAYVYRGLDTASGTNTQNAKLVASDGAVADRFGNSVSLSGSMGLVGAIGANTQRGSAYVYRGLDTASGTNTQNVKLIASDGVALDRFGRSVSLSGSMGLVGAAGDNSGQGSTYVYRGLDTATGMTNENAKLVASDGAAGDQFGSSVSLSGSMGLVGAAGDNSGQGSTYVYRRVDMATGTTSEHAKLVASDGAAGDIFGWSLGLSGSMGVVGAPGDDIGANINQGSAYVYRGLDTAIGTNTQSVKLMASDGAATNSFGSSVSLDGDLFVIAAPNANTSRGKAYSGSVSSITTLNAGSTNRTIDGVSFESWDDWIIGATTDSNTVTVFAGNSATVTNTGRAVRIGQNAGSDGNVLLMEGNLTANVIHVGAVGNSNNVLQLGSGGTNGTLSVGSVITNNGRVFFNRSDAITQGTHFGAVGISGSGALTKSGAGTLTLNATNTYSGATTVSDGTLALATVGGGALAGTASATVQSGAALMISADNQVADTASVTLSGGTIRRGAGVSEVFGNLDLTAGSFLDFGTGAAGTLRFGTYTPASLLTVNNFAVGNVLVFGSNLTASIANPSLFSFSSGFTYAWDSTNALFTITAIPEPTTAVAATGLLALLAGGLWHRQRMRG